MYHMIICVYIWNITESDTRDEFHAALSISWCPMIQMTNKKIEVIFHHIGGGVILKSSKLC